MEAIGTIPPARLGDRFDDPALGRLLRNLLLWVEAHVSIIRGRLAYGSSSVAASERLAVEMTVGALRSLPAAEAEAASGFLLDYLETMRMKPMGSRRTLSPTAWSREAGEHEPAWERLRFHLAALADHLGGTARKPKQIIRQDLDEARVRARRERSLVSTKGRVRTIAIPGEPVTALRAGPQGGAYILRGGRLEAVTPDRGVVILYEAVQKRFRPDLFAVLGEGEFLLVGAGGGVIVRTSDRTVRQLSPAPWDGIGHPSAIAGRPGGGFFAAVGSDVLEIDAGGSIVARHQSPEDVGDMAVIGGDLVISLPRSHEIENLAESGFRRLSGGNRPGWQDGSEARLRGPTGIAPASEGAVVVADTLNHAIRLVGPDGSASTIGGSGSGRADGPVSEALFHLPFAVAQLSNGSIAVAERGRSGIRLVGLEGEPILPQAHAADRIRTSREVYVHLDKGRALIRKGNYALALPELDKAVEISAIDSNLFTALRERALARAASSDWEGSAGDYGRARRLAMGDIDSGLGEAEALLRLSRPTEAIRVLEGVEGIIAGRPGAESHRDRRYPRVYLLRARAHLQVGDAGQALEAADQGIRIQERAASLYKVEGSKENSRLYLVRSRVHLDRRNPEKALEDCEKAVEIAPDEAANHAGLGDALVQTKRYDEGARAYRVAVRLNDESRDAHIGLARLYCRVLDDPDSALNHLDHFLELGGDQATAAEILSDLSATASDRRGSYAEVIRTEDDGKRYRLRIYADGKRVKIPYPYEE
ncbi:MAG: tetratricopeptide repeat protein [Planctomycetota bacterium]|nr:tetratricopeptide repeat protein [Planctomycetota bacterium]